MGWFVGIITTPATPGGHIVQGVCADRECGTPLSICTCVCVCVCVRPCVHMCARVRECVYVCGCVGVWVCGCVGVWVCGCVGVRVCGCLSVCLSLCVIQRCTELSARMNAKHRSTMRG